VFAPKIAKPQTKATDGLISRLMPHRSTLAGHRLGRDPAEQALFFQRTIGNQTTLRLLTQQGFAPTGEPVGGDRPHMNFSKIPLFPPDRASRPQVSSPLATAPVPGAIQAKLVVGPADDPLEREADHIADQVMHTPDPDISATAAPLRFRHKCAACAEEEQLGRKKTVSSSVAATSIVHETIASPGQPLDDATRAFMEPRFGHDFSQVRVHADEHAAVSARVLGALAYTVGPHIAFADRRYVPTSQTGRRLLAHELAHVAQQTGPAARGGGAQVPMMAAYLQRDDGQARQTPEALIRQWLEQHQFAPPERQPDEGERHVLLNGQDMALSDAVRLVGDALHQPADMVRSVILAALAGPTLLSLPGVAVVGPGNLVPGLPSSALGPTATGGISPVLGKMIDLQTIDEWLDVHHFYQPSVPDPQGDKVMLDGRETTIEATADRALAVVGGGGPIRVAFVTRQDVLIHLRQRYVAAPTGPTTQLIVGYTLVPQALQAVTPAPDPRNPLRTQHQFAFTMTRTHHASDQPGLESSLQGSVTINDAGDIVNLQAGGQEALVAPLLSGWMQISGFVQIMGSANWSRTATGSMEVAPAVQAAVGGQVLVTPQTQPVRLFNGRAALGAPQVGLQAMGTGQVSSQGPQAGATVGLVINIPFSL
jgi:Domain of unknown function (DUF4157)